MIPLGPSRAVPLVALTLVSLAAASLAVLTLEARSDLASASYVPWLLLAGWLAGVLLVLLRPRPVPSALLLAAWGFAVQLTLLPPGFSPAFDLLAVSPVLAFTVLALPAGWGPSLACALLGGFLASQGPRTAWGVAVEGSEQQALWGLAAVGLSLIAGTWSMRSAFLRAESLGGELTHLKEGIGQIVQANVGFQEHAASLEEASSRRERLRITREIHDIVGYTLTNQTMVLQAASVLLDRDNDRLRALLESAEEAARSGLQDVRRALHQLRAETESPLAFLNRLHQLCRHFEQATAVQVRLSGAQLPTTLPPEVELVLYRVVQEGLTNAFLHGKASRISVGLTQESASLNLHLADNGTSAETITEGIGMSGMRERLSPLGGTLDYRAAEHGFTLLVQIPLTREPS